MKFALSLAAVVVGALLIHYAYQVTSLIDRTSKARTCALDSYGTDAAIANCYTMHGLPVPENFNAKPEQVSRRTH